MSPIIFQALLVLVSLFFLFVMVMSFKTWKWFHPLLMLCVFAATPFLFMYTAMVQKTHSTWKDKSQKVEKQLEDLEKAVYTLEYGDPDSDTQVEPPDPNSPLLSVRSALQRLLVDRGTVWRGSQVTGINEGSGQVQLSTMPADQPNNIAVDDVVYAFFEVGGENAPKLPRGYLGEMKVVAATDNSVTVTPTRLDMIDPVQLNAIKNSNGQTWSLYSVMPLDSHIAFAKTPPEKNYKLPIFGEMDADEIRRMFPTPQNASPDVLKRHAEFVESYVRDGSAFKDSDPPETRWTRVKFVKEYAAGFEVDSSDAVELPNMFYFDPNTGMATAGNLKIGGEGAEQGKVTFKQDDFAVFYSGDPEYDVAAKLVADGFCEVQDRVFVRQLTDFDYSFKYHYRRKVAIETSIRAVQDKTARLLTTTTRVDNATTYRQTERTKLEEDKTKFVAERDAITEYANQLEEQWSNRRKEMAAVYAANLKLEEELERINEALAREINRRTIEATAQASP